MTCYSYPGSPGTPGMPSKTMRRVDLGWNSGANSGDTQNGDCVLDFTMAAAVVSAVAGLKPSRDGVGIPELITHGFYFLMGSGQNFYAVIEKGVIGSLQTRASGLDDSFEIRRIGRTVTYVVYDAVGNIAFQQTSSAPLYGPVIASGCLYASGDTIGS